MIPHRPVEMASVRPVDGLTIFAVFFVAALAIERLLEPLSNALLAKASLAGKAHDAMNQARSEASDYHVLLAEQHAVGENHPVPADKPAQPKAETRPERVGPDADLVKPANAAIQDAADAEEALSVRQLQRATAFWTIATLPGHAGCCHDASVLPEYSGHNGRLHLGGNPGDRPDHRRRN
jgi:hypothetical protein